MFIVGLLSWWYGQGWKQRAHMVGERLANTYDYFSIDLLVRTLFAPFRQISASQVRGSLGVKWRAFVDRLVSRCIGAIVRLLMIVTGIIVLFTTAVAGVVVVVLWGVLPFAPIAGLAMMLIGWVPIWM